MNDRALRVGIVGANAERGWAKDAHVPALAKLPRFQITAASSRLPEVAEAAAKVFGAEHVFLDSLELVKSPEVDIVSVCVRVPQHFEIVMAALEAGKHVFCEWPLGRTASEAEAMSAKTGQTKACSIVGLQGIGAPAIRRASEIIRSDALGRVLSARLIAPNAGWAPVVPPFYAYLNDRTNGATLATIGAGHALGMLVRVLGKFVEVQAKGTIQHPKVRIVGTKEMIDRTCVDHLAIIGVHESGCVTSMEASSNRPLDAEFQLEVTGTSGALHIRGIAGGGFQTAELSLDSTISHKPPSPFTTDAKQPAANVAELYTMLADKIDGKPTEAPDFAEALYLHRLLDAIERASDSGQCQRIDY